MHSRLAEHAESSVMIGDMFETDIAGAANVGLDQIYFNRSGVESEMPFEPTYTVTDLLEIKNIL